MAIDLGLSRFRRSLRGITRAWRAEPPFPSPNLQDHFARECCWVVPNAPKHTVAANYATQMLSTATFWNRCGEATTEDG
jgi:hypothetical protein